MATIKLNGETFKPLLVNGAQFLLNDIDRINALNVFPVPDGDTGTNMCLTIEGGVKEITSFSEENIGKMFKRLARSMTMSARGNSGVILSQFFKGMSNYLVDKEEADVHDLIEALLSGSARSYKVVQTPTEGTMLTVMREAAEYVKEHENEYSSIDDVLVNYVKAAQISLDNTPNLLPVLKEAGVIDSGGAGFVLIFEGMLLALNGTILKHEEVSIEVEEEEEFEIIEKKYAIVAVSPSEGISELLTSLECDVIVSGGQTMNPSSDDFIHAFKKLKAEYIFVFPNNKNIYMAAAQAGKAYKDANVIIIPTKSVAQCYSALTLLDYSSDDYKEIENSFIEATQNVITGSVTYAVRDTNLHGIEIHKNDYMTIIDGEIVASAASKVEAIDNIISSIKDIEDKSVITLIYGVDMTEAEINEVTLFIKTKTPNLEIIEINGGQEVYSVIVAIE